jgi:hypothetical protein
MGGWRLASTHVVLFLLCNFPPLIGFIGFIIQGSGGFLRIWRLSDIVSWGG